MRLRPDIPPEPLSALPGLRRRADLTLTELGRRLGVNYVTISGWETGKSDPPARVIRELALILGCGVNEILNGRLHLSRLKLWLERWSEDAPARVVAQLVFAGGGEYEFPLSERGGDELVYALKSRERAPWVGLDTADERLVFFNASALESFSVIPVTGTAARAKLDHVLIETISSKHLSSPVSDDLSDTIEILLRVSEDAGAVLDAANMNDWFLRLRSDGTVECNYRLGALRLIDAPLAPYRVVVETIIAEREEALEAARAAVEVTQRARGAGKGRRLIAGRQRPRPKARESS